MSHARPSCPRCFGALDPVPAEAPAGPRTCPACGQPFVWRAGVLDTLGDDPRETRAAEVEEFYTQAPFPGYAPGDDGSALLDRCRRVPFLTALDAAVPASGPVLDAGCGTAQISAFLALAGPRRQVFGVDGCRASLAHADEFRARSGIDNLQLVRGDLFDLPLPEGRFPVVISRGVVHHTPDPDLAIERVAARVAPGGFLVLGWYESAGRLFHCARRMVAKARGGRPIRVLDPVLRRKDLDEEKKRIWIEDQYRHPLEYILSLGHVLGVLEGLGLRWIRSVPPAPSGAGLFEPTARPGALGRGALRFDWARRGCIDPDAGLVSVVVQRPA